MEKVGREKQREKEKTTNETKNERNVIDKMQIPSVG